jgi:transposase
MPKKIIVTVKETVKDLKGLQNKFPSKTKMLGMLMLLKKQPQLTKASLAAQLGVSDKSIQIWRTNYLSGGIELMLQDNRGGYKKAAISPKVNQALSNRLNNPRQGFRSFIEVQQWLAAEFGIEMEYHAVNKYVKRKFGARLKVSRKSHVLKSPADEAVFKKPVRKAGTY